MAVSGYIREAFTPADMAKIVEDARTNLKPLKFDAIAVRGVSGMIIGPILCYLLDKHLIVVRKSISGSHAEYTVETLVNIGNYIVVDDFVATGKTLRATVDEIKGAHPALKPVGYYLWRSRIWSDNLERYIKHVKA